MQHKTSCHSERTGPRTYFSSGVVSRRICGCSSMDFRLGILAFQSAGNRIAGSVFAQVPPVPRRKNAGRFRAGSPAASRSGKEDSHAITIAARRIASMHCMSGPGCACARLSGCKNRRRRNQRIPHDSDGHGKLDVSSLRLRPALTASASSLRRITPISLCWAWENRLKTW